MITKYTLADALQSVGNAEVFIGDPFTADGMESLGPTEGRITFAAPREMNALTAPELTGGTPHQATVTEGAITITVPIISDGDLDALMAKINPTGIGGGGSSEPQDVFTTSVLLIPRRQIGGGLSWNAAAATPQWERVASGSVDAAVGADAAPTAAVWLWRAHPSFGELPFVYENGGKQVVDVTFTAMWYDGAVAIPEGHKVWTVGDPRRVGVAIPVIL